MDHPVTELLLRLMSIVSTTDQEHEIGSFLARHLSSLGWTTEQIAIAPGSSRHNVYAYLGNERRARVLLTAHMDTVPPHIPPSVDSGSEIIRGRGSSDDLGPLAAQIMAAEALRKERKVRSSGGDLGLLFVVGEEDGGHGMIAANDMGLVWEAGIFAEPTESKLAKGHKGQVAFEVIANGIACHSGYPHLGKSATSALLAVLNDLEAASWPESELLGRSTFNIGRLEGGEKHNIVAPTARALCEVRMVSDLAGVKARIAEVVARHAGVELQFVFEYPEVLLDWKGIDGFNEKDATPVAFGTDVPRLRAELCGKRVLYGPGSILVAHRPAEFIRVPELIDSIEAYKKLVLHFLRR